MSRQLKVKPKEEFVDLEAMYKGLLDLGFKENEIILDFENPRQVFGYQGKIRKGHLCPLFIPRQALNRYCHAEYKRGGASNDAGFFINDEGSIEISVSDYDISLGILTSASWQKKLKKRESVHRAIKSASKFGFKFQKEKQKGGKIVLNLQKGGW